MDETSDLLIKDITYRLQGNECIMNWHWADSVPCVYIYKSPFGEPVDLAEITEKQLKLYTREEYKAKKGYFEVVEGFGKNTYRIFPCALDNGKPVMLIPEGDQHIAHVNSGRAKIYYSFKRGRSWFSSYQSLQIRIFSETPIPKEVLCYVKKEGSSPINKDDGVQYSFLRDIEPGVTIMPEVEIKKKDFIRLFFTDGKKYGEFYELIPE